MATGLVIRTVTKIMIGPKRATAVVLQNGPVGIPCYAETTEVIAPVMANVRGHTGRTVHLTAAKASRDAEEAPVLHTTIRGHTPPRVDLCSAHVPFHSCTGAVQAVLQPPGTQLCTPILQSESELASSPRFRW